MNILIAYATNTGSTYLIAKHIAVSLEKKNHQVSMKSIAETSSDELNGYDFIFFGSTSWDYQNKEGQPNHSFMKFLEENETLNLEGKKFFVFGCGDNSFRYFCGAVDEIQKFIREHHGTVMSEPLKINKFYYHDAEDSYKEADEWLLIVENSLHSL